MSPHTQDILVKVFVIGGAVLFLAFVLIARHFVKEELDWVCGDEKDGENEEEK